MLWYGEDTKISELQMPPPYISPEWINLQRVDHRCDLWALGVVGYQALTGKLPFTGPWLDVFDDIVRTTPAPPSHIVPELGLEVDRFFERALAKDPECRFQSALEMAAAFAALAE